MIAFISAKFNAFVSRGTSPAMHELDRKHIWLLNVFYLVASFTYLAGVLETFLVDGFEEGKIILAMTFVFQGSLVFLLLKRHTLAQFYMVLTANATLFIFENRHGPAAGSYLYYFPLVMMIAFLVDFRKFLLAITNILATIGFIVLSVLLRYRFMYHHFPDSNDDSSFKFNLIFSGIMTATVALIIIRINYRQYGDFLNHIEERKQAEASMKLVIREKETLLAEIHHRVKNNLAVISSLLNLQMNTVNHEYTRNVLRDSRNRVTSMSLIHQKLYRNTNVEEIDFGQYAYDLIEEIRFSYPGTISENTAITVDAQQARLPLTIAIPCGLILNELLSNCYKHAFAEGQAGKIFIRFATLPNEEKIFRLEVSDTGKGLPAGFKIQESESLGMTIIQSLAEQIDAKWSMKNGDECGTAFQMDFKNSN